MTELDPSEAVIELLEVHQLFGQVLALDVESLIIHRGEKVFLLGHSGSGKTTLSRLLKGRLQPSTGTVRVLGQDPASRDPARQRSIQRRVAMIDQEFFLVPRMSVMGNVLTGCLGRVRPWRSLVGWYPQAEWKKAAEILEEVGLDALGHRRVETLSGGQRQRAAIARALMQEADIVVADEPTSSLDPELAEDVLELLVDCVSRRGVTLMVNFHQPELAKGFASRFIGLADGRVVYDGPPDGFKEEHSERVYRSARQDHLTLAASGMREN
ncbi:MAG: ATP-binding cassette domain-containing protein [Deltaproteobacteria bacterium]|nr:ATP-binding cassette domain-containing protein [Deltaproteobacteria bacterium]